MYEYFDRRFKKPALSLAPGEFYATSDDIVIDTVLGSCVSVVIYDPVLKMGGMNHFMLAETKLENNSQSRFGSERYGMFAMDALIGNVIKYGAKRERLKAKVFGGSRVLNVINTMNVGEDNIKYAEDYLQAEKIPIVKRDTGGTRARRIYFCVQNFRVFVRLIKSSPAIDKYSEQVKKRFETGGDAVLF
ncbi:MAG: hypothetical protein PQJ46_08840 [Spirochaetales bacterium]|nr:hypothetical protein [Spirochaetales bacterium]